MYHVSRANFFKTLISHFVSKAAVPKHERALEVINKGPTDYF